MATQNILWTPHSKETNLSRFFGHLETKLGKTFLDYVSFHKFSVDEYQLFWKEWLSYSGFKLHKEPEKTIELGHHFSKSNWFPGALFNFAENLLEVGKPQDMALVFYSEDGNIQKLTYLEMKNEVLKLQKHLISLGIKKGDRVVGLVPNAPISTIGMLATTSLGAIWSSASPDFGVRGILDRFEQINPKVLISVESYLFKGKKISITDKLEEVSIQLKNTKNSEFKQTLIYDFVERVKDFGKIQLPHRYSEINPPNSSDQMTYTSISFSDPVYIMFSSGTTGLPKCIVQGGGVLLNHTKELSLHCNLSKLDRFFYYTTCGWMMWNWSQSALALGATLYQFDGNPFHPNWEILWSMAEKESIKVFGTSAKYLSVLEEDKVSIESKYPLPSLEVILSTGSPLPNSGFRYVYENIKKDVQLSSISGGTDLNGCFALGNPNLPVYEGQIQCKGLGMDVQVFDDMGKSVLNQKGELVCPTPFPSMPLFFWNDETGVKYKSAYFETYDNIWCHGDFASITPENGLVIYGRSDATLNPGGVRIGTADIYSVVSTIPEVKDSVIIGQEYKDDVRVVLFVVTADGIILDESLIKKIKERIKQETSPRHVPSLILSVPEIPYTVNGKKVEIAVKQTVAGLEVKNKNALANPHSLEYFKNLAELAV
ncbi:acetoacetate--CoA ligase [Leptospira sp. 2 VSF19]|uniref:Acetoacetate--CoA ligase n=1 Tax=Leptospira soteropolitanensis TaxID=2950025 RepID=A0AAW5V8L3_9LEPT|nr:acetoacetate--CoA ligase [Leptospira soteropolitanensis]MCW7491185.1 acetoacetate--CoA ligase [Leptospira soteropolitanensis]MCW7498769.1 acetoacetate--CoA ligase [Leptospira soteropolitanensis]MCW7521638.1 acetoacetate--CoA ligase [Leptospira soteropolitanensis]MCW7524873.1 acetoacetate--CoA ligase [Leptospira soteropolitanensis]MCW7528740.1 acetoacetate--CoA ligase [Leptospira soteropolitanensis]